jgi:hypothetical protein
MNTSLERIFGYKHLHFIFRPQFRIIDDLLFYKEKLIRWEDVVMVTIAEGLFSALRYRIDSPGYWLRGKRMILTLKTGDEITIRCDLTQGKNKFKFRLSQLSDDYKWLRDWILSHIPKEIIEYK